MIYLLRSLTASLFLLSASISEGATFVGNGGNAGDIELAITLNVIRDTNERLLNDQKSLCTCKFDGGSVCELLKGLNENQRYFCRQTLKESISQISELAVFGGPVDFRWSDDAIDLKSGKSGRRRVDAVTQRKPNRITIDRKRFVSLSQSERTALIVHELFHLVEFQEGYVSDEEAIPPFQNGRHLLDALGASMSVAANNIGVMDDYERMITVSKAHNKHWIELSLKEAVHSKSSKESLLRDEAATGFSLGYGQKFDRFGARLFIERLNSSEKRKVGGGGQFKILEDYRIIGVGAGYYWQPLSDQMSGWSQSLLSVYVDGLYGNTIYQASDGLSTIKDKSPAYGAQVTTQAHIPIKHGFWVVVGLQLRYFEYEYKKIDTKVEDLQFVSFIGGAYAF